LPPAPTIVPPSGARAFLEAFGVGKVAMDYGRGETVFRQGDPAADVLYIQSGGVKLTVASKTRGRVVVGTLGPGDFFGEGCLANQPLRLSTATAITPSVIRLVGKRRMSQVLHTHPALCDWFIFNMLSRTMRVEEDLARQLFKTNEKRGLL
jgi:CRP/FNR family transcriptional regulator, cyclic AMP receptor protein